ncbi:MAG: hypothetical protein PHN78_07280 [Dehalococcoidales bacterium]|nr:hypothetical protein [Dehalococcoidales bacterium]
MEKEYLSCAETAKLVRAALKKKFPGVKFSVRSDVYSGGASIDIGWILGPTTKEVDEVGKQFACASFDASIDMETIWSHWLLPDGSAVIRSGPGTTGSMGYIPKVEETPMPEGAKPVHFGAHYIFAQRRYGQTGEDEMKLREQVARDMCKLQHIEYQNAYTIHLFGDGDTEQVDQHAWRLLNAISFAPGEVYDGVRYTEQGEDNGLSIPMVIIKKGGADNGGNGIGRKM